MKIDTTVQIDASVLMKQRTLIIEYVEAHYDKDEYDDHLENYEVANNMQQIIAMDNFLRCANDERVYFDHWLYIYPDECDIGEIMEMAASTEEMGDLLREFMKLLKLAWDANSLYNISYVCGKIEDERKINKEEDWL